MQKRGKNMQVMGSFENELRIQVSLVYRDHSATSVKGFKLKTEPQSCRGNNKRVLRKFETVHTLHISMCKRLLYTCIDETAGK